MPKDIGETMFTYASYEALGGLKGAMAKRAEEIVGGLPAAAQAALPRVLRALTTTTGLADQAPVARVAQLEAFAIGSSERTLIDAFIAARLLVAGESGAASTVWLAHEALIGRWQRAKDQLAADRRDLETRSLIERQLRRWSQARGRAQRLLLLRNPDLANAVDLTRRWGDELDTPMRRFIRQSRRRNRRRLALASATLVLLIAAIGYSIYDGVSAANRYNAALIEQSRVLARDAEVAIQQGNSGLALQLALAALPGKLADPDRPFVKEAGYALENAFANRHERFVLRGHQKPVGLAAFSPDGAYVVTTSKDNTARLWNVKTGEMTVVLPHTDNVVSAAFSPDSTRVVTASWDKKATVWDAKSGLSLKVLAHDGIVTSAVFSPDGTRVVTASDDRTARIWDLRSGSVAILRHSNRVNAAKFSPNGTRIVTASGINWLSDARDPTGANRNLAVGAAIWNAGTGALVFRLIGHENTVRYAAYSHDGRLIVTTSTDGTARLWDANKGMQVAKLDNPAGDVEFAAFAPDDSVLLTMTLGQPVRIWNAAFGSSSLKIGTQLATLGRDEDVTSASFSCDGSMIVTTSKDRTVRFWRPQDAKLLGFFRGHTGQVNSAAFSPDCLDVATASDDGTARVWTVRLESAALVDVLRGHDDRVTAVAFSPDGTQVLTASMDGTGKLWDMRRRAVVHEMKGHGGPIDSAKFSRDGQQILTASRDGTARLWDTRSGITQAVFQGHAGSVNAADIEPKGGHVVTASDDMTARIWDKKTPRTSAVLPGHTGPVTAVAFSPDGTRVVTGSEDQTARLWDVSTTRTLSILSGHEGPVTFVAFSFDGTRVLTASSTVVRSRAGAPRGDSSLRLWDAKTGLLLRELWRGSKEGDCETRGIYAKIQATYASFSPDGTRIAMAADCDSERIRLWDAATGSPIAVAHRDNHGSSPIVFSRDGRRLIMGESSGTAWVLDAASGTPIGMLLGEGGELTARGQNRSREYPDEWVGPTAVSPDGNLIAIGALDGTARLWQITRCQDLIDAALVAVRSSRLEFTPAERTLYFPSVVQPDPVVRIANMFGRLLSWAVLAGDGCY
jgi:WD40 repeat protein